jgi:phosphonate transport system permease protein
VADRSLRWSIFWVTRLVLNVLRSIPDLVWVLICIVVIGIGPFAGTVAIGLHTAGVLGKLYAETLEEVPRRPIEALRALGAGPFQLLSWGLWPQAKRMLASYTIVRWETNLRVSTILGLVGGGGLGQAIYNNVQLGFYARLSTLLLITYAMVMLSDWIGDTVFRHSPAI